MPRTLKSPLRDRARDHGYLNYGQHENYQSVEFGLGREPNLKPPSRVGPNPAMTPDNLELFEQRADRLACLFDPRGITKRAALNKYPVVRHRCFVNLGEICGRVS